MLRDGDGFHSFGHNLERGGLQNDIGIGLVQRLGVGFRRLQKRGEFLLPAPQTMRALPMNLAWDERMSRMLSRGSTPRWFRG